MSSSGGAAACAAHQSRVDDDAMQPRGELRVRFEFADGAERGHERVLHHIARVFFRSHEPPRDATSSACACARGSRTRQNRRRRNCATNDALLSLRHGVHADDYRADSGINAP
jgi:hypothetical protein